MTPTEYRKLKAVVNSFPDEARALLEEYSRLTELGHLTEMHATLVELQGKVATAEEAARRMLVEL